MHLPENSLKSMSILVGRLPPGDTPLAWYLSTHPDVVKGFVTWEREHKAWRDRLTELCELSGIKPVPMPGKGIKIQKLGNDSLLGIYHGSKKAPAWWRWDKNGFLVPRKRTVAEKSSEVNRRFETVRYIPCGVDFLPGMPHSLWSGGQVFSPQARKPAKAVLVFLGANPDNADPAFEPDARWSRMKLSIYHLLQERQREEDEKERNRQWAIRKIT